ncbi:MAG: ChaN family lipoprotein, partial [Desulfovibrionaceae bacterium]|nr:ChaN family lipoprotein [Desulfovibrionaceae bacterium]
MTLRAALLPALGLAAALALSACAARPAPAPPLGATFLPCPGEFLAQNGTRLSPDELLDMAGRADYLLVGEGHKNPCDHQVQATLVKALAESGRPLAIGLEMVARDKQDALDAFARGEIRVDGLEER